MEKNKKLTNEDTINDNSSDALEKKIAELEKNYETEKGKINNGSSEISLQQETENLSENIPEKNSADSTFEENIIENSVKKQGFLASLLNLFKSDQNISSNKEEVSTASDDDKTDSLIDTDHAENQKDSDQNVSSNNEEISSSSEDDKTDSLTDTDHAENQKDSDQNASSKEEVSTVSDDEKTDSLIDTDHAENQKDSDQNVSSNNEEISSSSEDDKTDSLIDTDHAENQKDSDQNVSSNNEEISSSSEDDKTDSLTDTDHAENQKDSDQNVSSNNEEVSSPSEDDSLNRTSDDKDDAIIGAEIAVPQRKEKKEKKKILDKKQRKENRINKMRFRLFPIWLRLFMTLIFCIIATVAGMYFGYVLLGNGDPGDVFKRETWQHILDLANK